MQGVTKQDLSEWLGLPVTKAKHRGVLAKIRELEALLGEGTMTNPSNPFETSANIFRVIGRIEGLKDSLEIDNDTVIGEDE